MRAPFVRLTVCMALAVWGAGICCAQAGPEVTRVPRAEIDNWLRKQVEKAGGDWSLGRFSFYFVYDITDHDALLAPAVNRIVFSLLNNSLTPGDRATAIACRKSGLLVGSEVNLIDDASARGRFVESLRGINVSQAGGGMEIAQSVRDIALKYIPAQERGSSVLILFADGDRRAGDRTISAVGGLDTVGFGPLTPARFKCGTKSGKVLVAAYALMPAKLVSLPVADPYRPRVPTFARTSWQPPDDAPGRMEALPNRPAKVKVKFVPVSLVRLVATSPLGRPPATRHFTVQPWMILGAGIGAGAALAGGTYLKSRRRG